MSEVHEIENFLIKTNEKPKKKREMNNEEKRRKMRETKITYSPQPTSTPVLITSDRYLQIPGECVHVRRARDYQKCTQDKIPPIY